MGLDGEQLFYWIIFRHGTRHRGIAEMPLQSREQKEWIVPPRGLGYLSLLLTEERFRKVLLCIQSPLILNVKLRREVDQIAEIEIPETAPHTFHENAPRLIVEIVARHRGQSFIVAETIAADRF